MFFAMKRSIWRMRSACALRLACDRGGRVQHIGSRYRQRLRGEDSGDNGAGLQSFRTGADPWRPDWRLGPAGTRRSKEQERRGLRAVLSWREQLHPRNENFAECLSLHSAVLRRENSTAPYHRLFSPNSVDEIACGIGRLPPQCGNVVPSKCLLIIPLAADGKQPLLHSALGHSAPSEPCVGRSSTKSTRRPKFRSSLF